MVLHTDRPLASQQGAGATTFKDVRRRCKTRLEAFYAFAAMQHEANREDAAERRCCLCGRAQELQLVRLTWRARFLTFWDLLIAAIAAIGHVHVGEGPWQRFETVHPMCGPCFRSWRVSRIACDVLAALGMMAVAAGAVAAILGLLLGYFGIMNTRDTQLAIVTGWTGVLVMAAGAAAVRVGRMMRIPVALRHIASGPIELESAKLVKV
jgi:hypothetical protein